MTILLNIHAPDKFKVQNKKIPRAGAGHKELQRVIWVMEESEVFSYLLAATSTPEILASSVPATFAGKGM